MIYSMPWYSLMGLGGWAILNVWLSDSKKAQNVALLIQLMQVDSMISTVCTHYDTVQVLMQLPVTLECLKQVYFLLVYKVKLILFHC